MKRTESTSSAQVVRKSQPKEFDLVILGRGTGSDRAFPILAPEIRERSVCPRISLTTHTYLYVSPFRQVWPAFTNIHSTLAPQQTGR